MPNLISAALSHGLIWAIEPVQGDALWRWAVMTDAEAHLSEFTASGGMPSQGERTYQLTSDGVAVIPLVGIMSKAPISYGRNCGTANLRRQIRHATADAAVKAIVIVVDSPGGAVAGTQDLADDITAAAKAKPVTAFVEDLCCSAAYWAVAGARRIVANQGADIGSLGVFCAIPDTSAMAEQMGVEILVFSTGPLKGAATPGTEVTDPQKQMFQQNVDAHGAMFLNAIKAGRKLTSEQTAAVFTGGFWLADEARSLGLIDAIGSLDSAIADIVADLLTADGPCDDDESGSNAITPPISARAGAPADPSQKLAGAGKALPHLGAGEQPKMKNILVRALTAFGLAKMATALTVATSEEPDAIASVMAEQVQAEVSERLANDPLTMACKANGITSAADLQKALEMKQLGETYLQELRGDAKAQATRAYGGEHGPQISAQVDSLPAASVRSLRDSWQKEADSKFGIGADGEPATRRTASKPLREADDADLPEQPKRPFERLNDAQKAHAKKQGMQTPEKQDAFARNLLGEVN